MSDEQQVKETQTNPEEEEEISTQGAANLDAEGAGRRVVEMDDEGFGEDEDDDGLTLQQRIKLAKMLGFDIGALYSAGDNNEEGEEEEEEDNSETFGTQGGPSMFRMGGLGGFMGGFGNMMFVESSSEEETEEPKTIEEKRKLYRCGDKFVTLQDIPTWEQRAADNKLTNRKKNKRFYIPNAELNKKVSLFHGDSTTLEIDAIVNAANSSLLGGGGIDGAIHRAAGRGLYKECKTLKGCPTGFTKLTKGHKLPAKYVLHTVGPTDDDPKALRSCYETCFQLVEQHNIKSVAFCCVSTGIFGFPLRKATKIALDVARKWLETNDNYQKVDRIIFVVFLEKEEKTYEKMMLRYFPLPLSKEEAEKEAQEPEEAAEASSEEDEEKRPSFSWSNWSSLGNRTQGTGSMFKTGAELYEERLKNMRQNFYGAVDDEDDDDDGEFYMPMRGNPMRVIIGDEDDDEEEEGDEQQYRGYKRFEVVEDDDDEERAPENPSQQQEKRDA